MQKLADQPRRQELAAMVRGINKQSQPARCWALLSVHCQQGAGAPDALH